MNYKRLTLINFLILSLLLLLAACAPETIVETVEVTRVVTETIIEEGAEVEVTRQVEVIVTQLVEVPVEPDAAAGSEIISGAAPPPPDEGAKVDETRSGPATESDEAETSPAEPRAESPPGSEATPLPLPTATLPGLASTTLEDSTSETSESGEVDLTLDQNSRLTAGEVDDNAQWDDYLLYLREYEGAAVMAVDVSERHQIWVRDSQENPILGAQVEIKANGQLVTRLHTHSNGLAYFFPQVFEIQADEYSVSVTFHDHTETFTIAAGGSQREWVVVHPGGDQVAPAAKLDVLFLIDATGSMADEIHQLKENIRAISAQIDALPARPDVRLGMVTYRDQGDVYVTQVFDFTPDIEAFAEALAEVEADGGGDYPEDLNEALSQAVHQVEWRVEETVSLIFLVADAPPHLDYGQENHYAVEMMKAAERGVKIYPIASSGLDSQGEYIFRQLAQYTGGRFIFLTYGESGPGSAGTETEFEVSDYTVSALDQLVVRIVEEELAYLVR